MSLWSDVKCPVCKTRGAKQLLWMIKCPNHQCAKYDPDLALEAKSRISTAAPSAPLTGSFNPGANAIAIRYTNAEGMEKIFTGDKTTLRSAHAHISVCLAPTGKRCSFSRDRIRNLAEIEPLIPRLEEMSGVERQVLAYHQAHGTTSPRYEAIKRKMTG